MLLKELEHFQKHQVYDNESKNSVQKAEKAEKSCPPALNEKPTQTKDFLLHV